MKNRLLPLTGLCAIAAMPNCYAKSLEQPNIVLVTCEDISLYLGCYGDNVAKSPNIDRFAEQGILFSQMHTTVGVSAPSRFALITGMYPSAMGANYMRTFTKKKEQYPTEIDPYYVVLPDDVKGFAEFMRGAGYYCVNAGKEDYQFNAPRSLWDGGKKAKLDQRPEGMPFLLVKNLMITHESNVWKQANAKLLVDPKDVVVPPYYPDNDIVRNDIAIMYSNVARMDAQFQAILDDIDALGEADNTIVIFMSDNGGPLPRQKRSIYESGTHVPFIVRFPDGYKAGTVDDRLSMFVDVPATILSLAGIKPPSYMHGQALLGKYEAKKDRNYVYAARDRMDEKYDKQGAIRDHRYRYIRNYNPEQPNYLGVQYRFSMPLMLNMLELLEQGKLNKQQAQWFSSERSAEEFYDDIADPHNVNNLIDDPKYAKEIARLRKEYDIWVAKYNERWLLSEKESRTLMLGENSKQPSLNAVVMTKEKSGLVLSSDNKGASIVYRINNKGFDENHWLLYNDQPITSLKDGDVVTAIATRAGYKDSKVATYTNN